MSWSLTQQGLQTNWTQIQNGLIITNILNQAITLTATLTVTGTSTTPAITLGKQAAGTVTVSANTWNFYNDSSGILRIRPGTDNHITVINAGFNYTDFDIDTSAHTINLQGSAFIISNNKITKYNNILTAGTGVSVVYASGNSFAQTANVASVVTYTPAAEGNFKISVFINVTAIAVGITPEVTYKDHNNVAQTDSIPLMEEGQTSLSLTATTADRYSGFWFVRAKNGTAITVLTTGYVSGTYDISANIEQVGI